MRSLHILLTGTVLTAGLLTLGCSGNQTLRSAFAVPVLEPLNESSIRAAAIEKFPLGTPLESILDSLPASKPDRAHNLGLHELWAFDEWDVTRLHAGIQVSSGDEALMPHLPFIRKGYLIRFIGCDERLVAIEVFQRMRAP